MASNHARSTSDPHPSTCSVDGYEIPRIFGHAFPRISGHGRSAAPTGVHSGPSAVAEQVLDEGRDDSGRRGGSWGGPWGRGRFRRSAEAGARRGDRVGRGWGAGAGGGVRRFEVGEPMVIERPHPFGRDVQRGYDRSQVFAFGEGREDGGSLLAWGAPS